MKKEKNYANLNCILMYMIIRRKASVKINEKNTYANYSDFCMLLDDKFNTIR